MNLETMRLVVTNNMPYDKGFMFMAGSKYYENEHFILCKYDTERVPYIIYNEEGTIYTVKNKNFIRYKTVGDLIRFESMSESNLRANLSKYNDRAKRRASTNIIAQGALNKIKAGR